MFFWAFSLASFSSFLGSKSKPADEIKHGLKRLQNTSDFRSSSVIRLLAPRSVEKTLLI